MIFLQGSKKEFFDFISKEDKIGILTHNDLDGIASAIFLEEILKSKDLKPDFVEFLEYKPEVFRNAVENKEVDKLFVSDLNLDEFKEDFKFIKTRCDLFLIDHHLYSDDLKKEKKVIKSDSYDCSAFVLYDLMKNFVKDYEKFNWLVCAAMVSDVSYKKKENFEFIQENYSETREEKIIESIPGKISQKIYSALIYFEDDLRKVYDLVYLGEISKFDEINKKVNNLLAELIEEYKNKSTFYPRKKLHFYFFDRELPSKFVSLISTKLSLKEQDETFVVACYAKKFIKISARDQSGKVNVSDLLRFSIESLEDATAGGHFKAAAANIRAEDLEKFRKNLENYNKNP